MADPFLAEIRLLPFNFVPKGWARCDGQILAISQNTALFSLLGTMYGGDGRSTFALPNLSGRAVMGAGQGPGLSSYDIAQQSGQETVALTQNDMPAHTHSVPVTSNPAEDNDPTSDRALSLASRAAYVTTAPNATLAPETLAPVGGSQPHANMQPYLTMEFCIALQGVFPPRS